MLNFSSDYLQGCCPEIMNKLCETNMEKSTGYGDDPYTEKAKKLILEKCGLNEGDIYFLVGGTQTNKLVITALLSSYQGVISADTGHINVHEAGAIENSGHKVIAIPSNNGKISGKEIEDCLSIYNKDENRDHMVMPGMVYISQPTEIGTLYSYDELKYISDVCKKYNIYFYIDGARLGYALASPHNTCSLKQLSSLCDAFYIGGTKCGALFGEALVTKKGLIPHFFTIIKQYGGILAKGRLLGIQFTELFTNDLYLTIAKNAMDKAEIIKEILIKRGYNLPFKSETNQIFVLLSDEQLLQINNKLVYGFWERTKEGKTIIRLATSWATSDDDVTKLLDILK